jgi:hypothetical protein
MMNKYMSRKIKIIWSVAREYYFFHIYLSQISHDLLNEIEIQNQQSDLFRFVDPTETDVLSSG